MIKIDFKFLFFFLFSIKIKIILKLEELQKAAEASGNSELKAIISDVFLEKVKTMEQIILQVVPKKIDNQEGIRIPQKYSQQNKKFNGDFNRGKRQ